MQINDSLTIHPRSLLPVKQVADFFVRSTKGQFRKYILSLFKSSKRRSNLPKDERRISAQVGQGKYFNFQVRLHQKDISKLTDL